MIVTEPSPSPDLVMGISQIESYCQISNHSVNRLKSFSPIPNLNIGVARIFSEGALFSPKKLTTIVSRRPRN